MLKSAFTLALAIVCFIAGSPAYGFWDPPYVTPSNPIAGQEVSVAVRAGICDAILEQEGYPQITRSGNELRILFFGVQIRNSDFCNLPIGTLVTPVASLPMGDYTLAVDVLYDNYPFGFDTLHLGVVPFTVTGSQQSVEPVPSIGLFAEFLLAVLLGAVALGLLAYPASRRPTLLCVFVYALHCQDAIADGGVIEFLVSNKPGAPTPDQIVAYYSTPLAQRSGPRKPCEDQNAEPTPDEINSFLEGYSGGAGAYLMIGGSSSVNASGRATNVGVGAGGFGVSPGSFNSYQGNIFGDTWK